MSTIYRAETGARYQAGADLEVMNCGGCGIQFAVPSDFRANRLHDRNSWWCPNGCQRHFTGETDAAKLKRERERSARLVAERDQLDASRRGYKIAASRARNERDRIKRRAAAGVCPCCNRTFKQLARHMAGQHPDFVAEAAAPRTEATP